MVNIIGIWIILHIESMKMLQRWQIWVERCFSAEFSQVFNSRFEFTCTPFAWIARISFAVWGAFTAAVGGALIRPMSSEFCPEAASPFSGWIRFILPLFGVLMFLFCDCWKAIGFIGTATYNWSPIIIVSPGLMFSVMDFAFCSVLSVFTA